MGIFNKFIRRKKEKFQNVNINTTQNNEFWDIVKEIEEYKYVNDDKTNELYDKAFKKSEKNIINRHFYYNNIIEYYYGMRDKQTDALEKCIEYCKKDIEITPQVLSNMEKDDMWKHYNQDGELVFTPPRFPSFQRLAIIYDNLKEYEEAIKVCKKAIYNGLKDGTKTGFEGRIERLEKKL